MVTLDLPWDVDLAEDHHLVVDEEHVPGPAVDRQARGLGHGLGRPGGEEMKLPSGQHCDAGAVVLDEVRLVHARHLGVGGADAGGPAAATRSGHRAAGSAGTDRDPPVADVVVVLPELLEAALHLQHQRVLDRGLELAAAGDLGQERVAVDAPRGGNPVAARVAGTSGEDGAQEHGSQDGTSHSDLRGGSSHRPLDREPSLPGKANVRSYLLPHGGRTGRESVVRLHTVEVPQLSAGLRRVSSRA